MAKVSIGNVYALRVGNRWTLFHVINRDAELGELIRVFPNRYTLQQARGAARNCAELKSSLMVFFSVSLAVRDRVAILVGRQTVPRDLSSMPNTRSNLRGLPGFQVNHYVVFLGATNEQIRRTSRLTKNELRAFPSRAVPNLARLREMLRDGERTEDT